MNLGIAGLGWWGQRLVRSVQGRSDKVRFTAAAVAEPAKRKEVARELGLELTSSLDSLLTDPNLHGVVIATPHSLHAKQVERAAAARKHVFCEKPLALTASEAHRAIRACTHHRVTLGVGHNRRFAPNIVAFTEIVKSGRLGKLLHIEGHWSNENTTRPDFGAWRASPLESPGAGIMDTGIHVLDIMTSLFGRAQIVKINHRAHSSDTQPTLSALSVLMEFAGGVSGLLATVRSTPRFWRVHAFGLEGSVEARGDTELRVYGRDRPAEVQHFPETDTLRRELEAFADTCNGLGSYPVTHQHLVDCAATLEDIVARMTSTEGTHD